MRGIMRLRTWKQLLRKGAHFLIVCLARLQQFATCFIIIWTLLIAAQQHLWPAGPKGHLKGVETSSKGKRLLTGEETVLTCYTSHTSPAFPARGFQAVCDGGPAIALHRHWLCPRGGPRVEWAGVVLTSNRELGSPPSWAFPCPSELLLHSLPRARPSCRTAG